MDAIQEKLKRRKLKTKMEEKRLIIEAEGKTPQILSLSPEKPIRYEIVVEKEKENLYSIDIYAKILLNGEKEETFLNTLNETLNVVDAVINHDKEKFERITETGEIELNEKETKNFLEAIVEEINSKYYNESVFEDLLIGLGILTE